MHTCIIAIDAISQNCKRYEIKDESKEAVGKRITKMAQTCHKIHNPVVSIIKFKIVEDTKISLKIETDKINMKCIWRYDMIWCMSGIR